MLKTTGVVYLVGAGPGDPGLFTLKGKELLSVADTVVYDRLVNPEILAWAAPGAEMIYVGKSSRHHSWPQEAINQVLLERVAAGNMVVRLKGGDPFVFGRGGEEAEFLVERGFCYEVVPGITSAIAVPAYAGIPVTHRDTTSSFAIITGHERPDKTESSINWDKIATGVDTLVFLMGLENLSFIVENLIAYGRAASTPVAVINRGTLPGQRVVEAHLSSIVSAVEAAGLQPPVVILVGATAALRTKLQWLEHRPLWGKRILVTRARGQASALSEQIRALGGQAFEFPSIVIRPAEDMTSLYQALDRLSGYQWLCFTSANGVEIFFQTMMARELDIRTLAGIRLAAIGPATAEALYRRGLNVDVVPPHFKAEALADALLQRVRAGERLLLPRAAGARDVLPTALRAAGVEVEEIILYQAARNETAEPSLHTLLSEEAIDYITFTSSSTVSNLVDMVGPGELKRLQGKAKIVCIGPITAETVRKHGLTVDMQAEQYTIDALLAAMIDDAQSSSRKE